MPTQNLEISSELNRRLKEALRLSTFMFGPSYGNHDLLTINNISFYMRVEFRWFQIELGGNLRENSECGGCLD